MTISINKDIPFKMLHLKTPIAALLLGIFLFSFLHSELNVHASNCANHDAHDYCQIVKTANTKISKISLTDLFSIKAPCFIAIANTLGISSVIYNSAIEELSANIKPKSEIPLYIRHSVLII